MLLRTVVKRLKTEKKRSEIGAMIVRTTMRVVYKADGEEDFGRDGNWKVGSSSSDTLMTNRGSRL